MVYLLILPMCFYSVHSGTAREENIMSKDPAKVINQFLQDGAGLSNEQIVDQYRAIMSHLPDDVAADANDFVFSQLPENVRQELADEYKQAQQNPSSGFSAFSDDGERGASPRSLAKMSLSASKEDPNILSGIFGKDSEFGGTLGRLALAAIATYLTQRYLNGGNNQNSQNQQGSGLGSILGSVLSGGNKQQSGGLDIGSILGSVLASQAGSSSANSPAASNVDIGSLLSVLLGAAGTATQPTQSTGLPPRNSTQSTGNVGLPPRGSSQPSSASPAGGVDLGSILGSILASQGCGKQSGGADLGSLLGSILGGSQGFQSSAGQPTTRLDDDKKR
jgi:hypothetical protein